MPRLSEIYFGKTLKEVSVEDVQKLIIRKEQEDYTLDYKEISKHISYDNLARVISAFLNTRGGLVIFGVSEIDHKYPNKITWGNISKEDLIRNLYNKVVPWDENIDIHPMENPVNNTEYIFLIDVPKSKNPPHMGSEKYYYRNVFESRPMDHYQVKNAFNENWLMKKDLVENVLGPIFNDIEIILNNISYDYNYEGDIYHNVNKRYRYLLYQIDDLDLIEGIDDFYRKLFIRNQSLNRYDQVAKNIIKSIIKSEFPDIEEGLIDRQDSSIINLVAKVKTTDLRYSDQSFHATQCLLLREDPKNNITKRDYIVEVLEYKYELFLDSQHIKIDESKFIVIWQKCISDVSNNQVFKTIWESTDEIKEKGESLLFELHQII